MVTAYGCPNFSFREFLISQLSLVRAQKQRDIMGAAAPDLSDYRISAQLWSSDDVATRTLLLYCAADLSGPTGSIYVY